MKREIVDKLADDQTKIWSWASEVDYQWSLTIFNDFQCRIMSDRHSSQVHCAAIYGRWGTHKRIRKDLEAARETGEPWRTRTRGARGEREDRDKREDERMIKDDMRPCGARFAIDLRFCRRSMEIINMIRGSSLINQPWAAWQHPGFFSQRSCNGFLAKNTFVQHKPAGTLRHNTRNADQSSFWIKALVCLDVWSVWSPLPCYTSDLNCRPGLATEQPFLQAFSDLDEVCFVWLMFIITAFSTHRDSDKMCLSFRLL